MAIVNIMSCIKEEVENKRRTEEAAKEEDLKKMT